MKRKLLNKEAGKIDDSISTFQITFNVNKIILNLGQKDLHTLNFLWFENFKKIMEYRRMYYALTQFYNHFYAKLSQNKIFLSIESEDDKRQKFLLKEEEDLRKLQEFFNRAENNEKYLTLTGNFDGLLVCLFSDIDEVLN